MLTPIGPLAPLRSGGLPLHRRAEDALRRLLSEPEYANGGLLPDELSLATRLGVSRGTIRAALLRLVGEGRLERRAGVGTRVLPRCAESAISAWRSLSREMARQGVEVRMFRCELRELRAPAVVAVALHIPVGTRIQRLDRVRGWGEAPALRARSWFHPRVRFQVYERFRRPLYDLVAEVSGRRAEHASESLAAVAATDVLAKDLKVKKGSPVLLRRHTVFDAQSTPLEFSEVHYVSERFTLTLDLKRE